MKQIYATKILLAVSLFSVGTGCSNYEVKTIQQDQATNFQTISSKEAEKSTMSEKDENEIKVIQPSKETEKSDENETVGQENKSKSKDSATPSVSKKAWVFADTHTHPYEGTLESVELKDSDLISVHFKAKVAIITPTNPVQDVAAIGSRMGKISTYPVRNDKEQSSKLTQKEISRLKTGSDFLILIDDWRNEKDKPIKATDIQSIYYKKDGNYYSIKGDRLFDTCSLGQNNECLRITK